MKMKIRLIVTITLLLILTLGCVAPEKTPTPTSRANVQSPKPDIPENIYYAPIEVPPINDIVATVTIIETEKQNSLTGTATGFFYSKNDSLYLITNKHVVNEGNPDKLILRLHKNPNNIQDNGNYLIELYDNNGNRRWLEHKISEIDVIAIPLNPKEITDNFFIKAISKTNFLPENLIIDVGEDVFVIGYPRGFFDTVNNLPIYRNAMIASTYPVPFRGNPYFLIDAQLHPGTSGSPVFTKPKTAWKDKSGATDFMSGNPIYFLGIHSASWSFNNSGKEETLGLNTVWFGQLIEEIIP